MKEMSLGELLPRLTVILLCVCAGEVRPAAAGPAEPQTPGSGPPPHESLQSLAGPMVWEGPQVGTHEGEDWRRPYWAPERSPFGGFYQIWGNASKSSDLDMIDVVSLGHWSWRKLNPEEGRYNFKLLEEGRPGTSYFGLKRARRLKKRTIFWMPIYEAYWKKPATPQWVIDKYRVPLIREYKHWSAKVSNELGGARGYAIWEDGPRRELGKLIREIGRRYRDDPYFTYAYVCTFHAGGEFCLGGHRLRGVEALGYRIDTTVKDFCRWLIDTWAEAIGPEKCIWEGLGNSYSGYTESSNRRLYETTRWVCRYALEKGLQFRTGFGENFFQRGNIPVSLMEDVWDQDGYIVRKGLPVDFFGDEIEARTWVLNDYTYFKLMSLGDLSVRFNYLMYWMDIYDLQAGPPPGSYYDGRFAVMRDYVRGVLGFPPEKAPDAWCALREMYSGRRKLYRRDDPYDKPHMVKPDRSPVKNYELFLYQRDVQGGMTQPAMKRTWRWSRQEIEEALRHRLLSSDSRIGEKKGALKYSATDYTYEARRTDRETGNRDICFRIDESFLKGGPHKVVVMVTYLDRGRSRWTLKYDSGRGPAAPGAITLTDTGKIRTAVLRIADIHFGGAQRQGMDFRITADGPDDVAVQLVRVLRMEPPGQ